MLALVLRVVLIVVLQSYKQEPSYTPGWFGAEAGSIARSLAEGHGFASPFGGNTGPTAWLSPVYPLLCAAVFKLSGSFSEASARIILALNSLFAALTVIPIYLIGIRLFSRRVAWLSAFVWAVLPYFMRWPTTMVWETSLSALLVSCTVLAALRLADSGTTNRWAGYGALAGFSALVNPAILTISVLGAVWGAVRLRGPDRIWHKLAISLLILLVIVSPWLLRNRLVFGRDVFLRDNFGFEFHLGNYHLSNGMGWEGRHPIANPAEYRKYRTMGEVAYVSSHQAQAFQFVRQYPGEFAALTWTRFQSFWNGSFLAYLPGDPWKPWMYWSLNLLTGGGLALALSNRVKAGWLLGAVMLVYPLPYYLTYPIHRYRHVIEPEMLLLALYLCISLGESLLAGTGLVGKTESQNPHLNAKIWRKGGVLNQSDIDNY